MIFFWSVETGEKERYFHLQGRKAKKPHRIAVVVVSRKFLASPFSNIKRKAKAVETQFTEQWIPPNSLLSIKLRFMHSWHARGRRTAILCTTIKKERPHVSRILHACIVYTSLSFTREFPRVSDWSELRCSLNNRKQPSKVAADNSSVSVSTAVSGVRPSEFLCSYETHCFALCMCCDFFACDCRMKCSDGCHCFHDQVITNIHDVGKW